MIRHLQNLLKHLLLAIVCFFNATGYSNENDSDKETLIIARENAPNSFDMQRVGSNRASTTINWNIYDRLITLGRKQLASGAWINDSTKIEPMLAESWEYDADGSSLIFHLRKNAKFHDGTPVTAHDVKWSFDRGVSIEGFSKTQMKAGGLENPSQFIVIDDHTFKITLPRKDKLTLPNLTVPVASIFNSTLAKQHVTDQDPWAQEWLRAHDAGSGAFKIASFIQDIETVYVRNDEWVNGPLPKLKKVIEKIIPSPAIRENLLKQGKIDIAFELPPKMFEELMHSEKFTVIGIPIDNHMVFLDMNVKKVPFNNLKVRQAIAYAIPYKAIFENALFSRGVKLFGGTSATAETINWPQPFPYYTDLKKAKELLTEAGYPNGFSTDLYFDMGEGVVNEVAAKLIKDQLQEIGINVNIKRVIAKNWREEMSKKEMPFLISSFYGWLNFPDYFFFWNYHSQNAVFNTMSYQNTEMDQFIEGALQATNEDDYKKNVAGFITKAFNIVARIPLFQKYLDVATQKNVQGYTHWYHGQLDYKFIYKD